MHRILFSGLLLTLFGILLSGCVSPPDAPESKEERAGRRPAGSSVPTVPSGDRSPGESSAPSLPTVPDAEQDTTEPSEGEFDDTEAPEPWTPPTTIAPNSPHPTQRRSIARWVGERPLRLSIRNEYATAVREHAENRGRDLLYRSYLNQLLADAMVQFQHGAVESSIVLTISPKFQSDESDRNVYGATTLIVMLAARTSPSWRDRGTRHGDTDRSGRPGAGD